MCYFYCGQTFYTCVVKSFYPAGGKNTLPFSWLIRICTLVAVKRNLSIQMLDRSPQSQALTSAVSTWPRVRSQNKRHGCFISPKGLDWRAASHSTCVAYCKGSPTVQIFHLSTAWLGEISNTQTLTDAQTLRKGTRLCTTDAQISKKLHSLTSPHL